MRLDKIWNEDIRGKKTVSVLNERQNYMIQITLA
jgi:hypothetical protein